MTPVCAASGTPISGAVWTVISSADADPWVACELHGRVSDFALALTPALLPADHPLLAACAAVWAEPCRERADSGVPPLEVYLYGSRRT